MSMSLLDIFDSIGSPSKEPADKPLYAVMSVSGYPNYFVGKDKESFACFLVATGEPVGTSHPPIRLESLDAQFELRCRVKKTNKQGREGTFTVIRCRDSDRKMTRYFFSVCEAIVRVLGETPTRAQIARAINRLAAIFQKIRQPSARSLNGLFGELYLLLRSRDTAVALSAWRSNDHARFDFSTDDVRLDVKATGGRNRIHTFSYEQCNPPSGTVAAVASLHAEQAAGGESILSITKQIESQVSSNADLVFKLHETVAATLGANLNRNLQRKYDLRLAASSLKFFELKNVPAIRGILPVGVSDVHFRSDLSGIDAVSIDGLIDRNPKFWELLPSRDESA